MRELNRDHPAIFVCANNGLHAWRKILKAPFEELCRVVTNAQEACKCIKENTFDLADILYGVVDGNRGKINEPD